MSKYVLVKSNYVTEGGLELPSFCVIKKKRYNRIVDEIDTYFDRAEQLEVKVEDEVLIFNNASQLVETLQVMPLKNSGVDFITTIFGAIYGECSLLKIEVALHYEALMEEIIRVDEDFPKYIQEFDEEGEPVFDPDKEIE
jgi:hypothetical protein